MSIRKSAARDCRTVAMLSAAMLLALVSTAAPAQSAPKPQLVGPLSLIMQPLVDSHQMAGAVALVANKNKVLDLEAVGYADIARQIPMRTNHLFWIASMSKAMTASALMMLVDEGKVNVDDPVEKYLPEFKVQMVRAEMPAKLDNPGDYTGKLVPQKHREMMCHTAGLPFRSRLKEHSGALDKLPLVEAVRAYAAEPLLYQAGTAYSYSNEDLNTAARIVEVVSGMPYEQFMQQRLFAPLGMTDTTFWPNAGQIARLAKNYKPNDKGDGMVEAPLGQLTLPLDDHAHRFPMPAGGLFSTAHDVMCFMQMLLNNGTFQGQRILSEASVHEMTSVQDKDLTPPYGFGLTVHPDKFDHAGANKTYMVAFPKSGAIMVFMVQVDGKFNDGGMQARLEEMSNRIVASVGNK